jgi:hypothetical protein
VRKNSKPSPTLPVIPPGFTIIIYLIDAYMLSGRPLELMEHRSQLQKTSHKLGEARTVCEMKTQATRWTQQGGRCWRGGDPCAAGHTDSGRALVSQRRPGPLEHQEIGTGREACLRRRRGRRLRFVSSTARSVPAGRTGGPPAIFIQGVREGKIKRVRHRFQASEEFDPDSLPVGQARAASPCKFRWPARIPTTGLCGCMIRVSRRRRSNPHHRECRVAA